MCRLLTIVSQKECAECGDPKNNREGVCEKCNKLYLNGKIVKIKDTMDKDNYSCGCYGRSEGVYFCDDHGSPGRKGPFGTYDKELDLNRTREFISEERSDKSMADALPRINDFLSFNGWSTIKH